MAVSTSTSLSLAVAQAVAYLTRPLIVSYPATTIIKLQLILEANLTALFGPTWVPKDPSKGSGRRCITLSPDCLPPRPVYSACVSAGVQWFDWIAVLGGREFDLFVDPGRISIRYTQKQAGSNVQTVWSDDLAPLAAAPAPVALEEARIQAQLQLQIEARARAQRKTLAQQLLEEDQEEDERLFALIADRVTDPAWTPIIDQFPMVPRSISSLSHHSAHSSHSRSSSISSISSSLSGFSFSGSSESVDSFASASSSASSSPVTKVTELSLPPKQSRRERARQTKVYIDTTKTEVTPYDGGKTTVLTGGVMLGAKTSTGAKTPKPTTTPTASTWRTFRS
jgi:hypothetical protein